MMVSMKMKIIMFVALIVVAVLIVAGKSSKPNTVLTWETCVAMQGSVIQESYPARCVTNDGRSVVQTVLNSSPPPTTNSNYYGSSTHVTCASDSDCIESGCNSEICQGKTEELVTSICVLPDQPTPKQVGLRCRCFAKKCQWN